MSRFRRPSRIAHVLSAPFRALLTDPWVMVRPGRAGRWPPRASMARAMSASGERNPNAMQVSRRILCWCGSIEFRLPPRLGLAGSCDLYAVVAELDFDAQVSAQGFGVAAQGIHGGAFEHELRHPA